MGRTLVTVFVAFGVSLLGVPARAGQKAQFSLVNAFRPCDVANTTMQTTGTPACAPAVADGVCAFGPTGSGKLTIAKIGSATKGTQDLKISAIASGLNSFCEGLLLWVRLAYRLTANDCPEGTCTAGDTPDLIVSEACTVTGGSCKISSTISITNPGLLPLSGKTADIQILGCGLGELSLLDHGISCGLLLP